MPRIPATAAPVAEIEPRRLPESDPVDVGVGVDGSVVVPVGDVLGMVVVAAAVVDVVVVVGVWSTAWMTSKLSALSAGREHWIRRRLRSRSR
jgi:hypothetical protein